MTRWCLMAPASFSRNDPWDPGNPENCDRTRRLQRELRTRLLAWDPIGVADAPEAQDEYDCMISPLIHQLHGGATPSQIAGWLSRELDDHFGLRRQPEREVGLASELVTWWQETTRSDA